MDPDRLSCPKCGAAQYQTPGLGCDCAEPECVGCVGCGDPLIRGFCLAPGCDEKHSQRERLGE